MMMIMNGLDGIVDLQEPEYFFGIDLGTDVIEINFV